MSQTLRDLLQEEAFVDALPGKTAEELQTLFARRGAELAPAQAQELAERLQNGETPKRALDAVAARVLIPGKPHDKTKPYKHTPDKKDVRR